MNPTPELTCLIREGHTFAVHRGLLPDGRRPVICKSVSTQAGRADAAHLLEHEFRLTRALSHPGHVRALSLVDSDRGPMLVFPDDGLCSLDLCHDGPMAPESVCRVARTLAEIVGDLHNHGIIHRDIKPSNIIACEALQKIHLIDYALAIRAEDLAREEPGSFAAQGTLVYMAPEQSGRMNRVVDHRADLYSLGITLYQLLTGAPPFIEEEDSARLLYRHMTEVPPAPHVINDAIPRYLSLAIMTLIEKNPEDRFQSAEEFLATISSGSASALMRLKIPDKLYGREALIAAISAELAQDITGSSKLYRISGQAGIGKSALVKALVAPAVAAGANFIQGKFDQLELARPYGPFLEACNQLLRRILAGTAENVEQWRLRIAESISPNGQVLLDILPEYISLIGPQPPVAELGLNEARIRMSLVFRRFVRALARPDEPLLIFFDDLQWSDSATRSLIELLLADQEIRHLALICAYRDNEIGAGHPVTMLFSTLEARLALAPEIKLGPLDECSVAQLVADSLSPAASDVAELARLVSAKTAGNPFFVRQFLLALNRKGLIRVSDSGWQWNPRAVEAEQISGDVTDLVLERIRELPEETQQIVQLAACSGNTFHIDLLALSTEQAPSRIAKLLESAAHAQLILPIDGVQGANAPAASYRFQHDRVQQAAHDMLAPDLRSQIHARIGTLLLQQIPEDAVESRLIEITDHLIAGRRDLAFSLRPRLRDLALSAASRTKRANAWDAAWHYLDIAEEMLGPNAWNDMPALAFILALEKAEAAYLQNCGEKVEEMTEQLLSRELAALDRVRVLELIILLHTSRLAYRKALQAGQSALTLLDENLPMHPSVPALLQELLRIKLKLRGRTDESLMRLPRMTDPRKLAATRILGLMAAPAYFTERYLLPVIALRIVSLSVRFGNAPHSPYGYVLYGMMHCAVLNAPERGLAYGELARRVALDLQARDIEGPMLMVYAGFIQHWIAPLIDTLPVFQEAWEKSLLAGNLENHGYARYGHASYALMAGQALPRVAALLDEHLAAVTNNPHEKTQRIMLMARASIARMRGLQPDASQPFDEVENFAIWTEQADATSLAYFHKYKMIEAMMTGNPQEVLAQARGMTANLNGILSMAYQPFYQFYEALALIDLARSGPLITRLHHRARARLLCRRLQRWARLGAKNFAHRALLLQAELDALAGRAEPAIGAFEHAIAGARRAGALHDVGLFNERAARFYLQHGAEEAAGAYLANALATHAAWGGGAWIQSLEARYPNLARPRRAPMRNPAGALGTEVFSSSSGIVDSTTLISTATALASKTSLTEVIEELMRAIAVNAGANRGVLMLYEDATLKVVAESESRDVRLMTPCPAGEYAAIPAGIVNFVERATSRVLLDDATLDPSFGSDPYIRSAAPSSVLCVPLMSQGKPVGVIYLENTRVRSAFTPERCQIVSVLGAQAAISLENARLFTDLREALERQVELTSAHARFVPHSFLQMLDRPSIADIRLGDYIQAEASILFSDIRGFTSLVENMEPVEAIDFINAYLSRMEPAVQVGGGFVDSYIGDAVMAAFDLGPEAAITAALAMVRNLRGWSRELNGQAPIRVGIGIATGEMIFGTIGAANRLKCGVIGDPVNLAARVEGLTKRYGLELLITEATYRSLQDPNRFMIREIDLVLVAGRDMPVGLYEVFDADPADLREQKLRTRAHLAQGLRHYRDGGVDQAQKIFEQCHANAPDDPLPPVFIERCRRNRSLASASDWDGIERIAQK